MYLCLKKLLFAASYLPRWIKVLKFLNKLTVVEFTMYALSSQIFLYANFTEMFFPLKKYKIIFQNFARCEAKLVKIN